MKRLLLILPIVVILLLACTNGKQEQAMEQRRIQDSIEQARLDSVERVRKDSLEQLRQDSIEKAIVKEKVAFLINILHEFDISISQGCSLEPERNIKKCLSKNALKKLWHKDRLFDDQYCYDWGFFQDGGMNAEGTDGDYSPVATRNATQIDGDWFEVRTTFQDNIPYPTKFQVKVEEVDGRYMITDLKYKNN